MDMSSRFSLTRILAVFSYSQNHVLDPQTGARVLSDAYMINPKLILFICGYFNLFVVKRAIIINIWAKVNPLKH